MRALRIGDQCTTVDWFSTDGTALRVQRNNVVTIRMFLLEKNYNDWETRLLNDTRTGNFVSTLASLGLSGAGSVISPGKTSKTLAALNSAVTGGKQAFDKDVMLDRTLQILITQMRASRAKAKELLIKRLSTSYDEWPIGLAMVDLAAYEQAGTLSAALTAVAENAATEKKQNEDRADQAIRTFAYDGSAAGIALQDYIGVEDKALADKRTQKLAAAMTAAGVKDASPQGIANFAVGNDPLKRDVIVRLIAAEKDDVAALATLAGGLASQ